MKKKLLSIGAVLWVLLSLPVFTLLTQGLTAASTITNMLSVVAVVVWVSFGLISIPFVATRLWLAFTKVNTELNGKDPA